MRGHVVVALVAALAAGACGRIRFDENTCTSTFGPGLLCGGVCIDTMNDPQQCGGCGYVCPDVLNAAPACNAGTCGRGPCAEGFFDLDDELGCESTCVDTSCATSNGTVVLTNPPLPETGAVLSAQSEASSIGTAHQTGGGLVNEAVIGEGVAGSALQTGDNLGLYGSFSSMLVP